MVVLPAASSPTYETEAFDVQREHTAPVRTINIPGESEEAGVRGASCVEDRDVVLTHLLLAKEAGKKAGDGETHGC